jgi:hypothetical protein
MWAVNSVLDKVFDGIFLPLGFIGPGLAIVVVSFLTGLLMLAVFRWTSNQTGIRKAKTQIKAHLLEIRLYKDNLRQSLKAQGRVLAANVRYIAHALRPMLVMIVPVMLILFQLNLRFGVRALTPGESVLLKVRFTDTTKPEEMDVRLQVPPGVVLETPPIQIAETREIDWRLSAESSGRYPLLFRSGGTEFSFPLVVGPDRLAKVPNVKPGRLVLDQAAHPGDAPVPKGTPVASVEIAYPSQKLRFLGLNIHWLVAFFGLSIIFGFAFKGVMKVEI